MTKYRLNIKYPIEKDNFTIATKIYLGDGVELKQHPEDNNSYSFDGVSYWKIPKSWIEEIKNVSEWDKWWNEQVYNEGLSMDEENKRLKIWCRDTWQASEENRDLLYKDLIESVEYFFECVHGTDENERLADSLKKIKALTGNV